MPDIINNQLDFSSFDSHVASHVNAGKALAKPKVKHDSAMNSFNDERTVFLMSSNTLATFDYDICSTEHFICSNMWRYRTAVKHSHTHMMIWFFLLRQKGNLCKCSCFDRMFFFSSILLSSASLSLFFKSNNFANKLFGEEKIDKRRKTYEFHNVEHEKSLSLCFFFRLKYQIIRYLTFAWVSLDFQWNIFFSHTTQIHDSIYLNRQLLLHYS